MKHTTPAELDLGGLALAVTEPRDGTIFISMNDRDSCGVASLDASQCRELAAWLLMAADQLDPDDAA